MSTAIAYGVFTWCGTERRSDRYGFFTLTSETYSDERVAPNSHINHLTLRKLVGKKVHIMAEVAAARESGHVGDLFHEIYPTKPEVGERVDLGVGILELEDWNWAEHTTAIGLKPQPERGTLWIDPRKLYRLHDQTVFIFVEETDDDFTPAPDLPDQSEGAKKVPSEDCAFQTKGNPDLTPKVVSLGDGMFMFEHFLGGSPKDNN